MGNGQFLALDPLVRKPLKNRFDLISIAGNHDDLRRVDCGNGNRFR